MLAWLERQYAQLDQGHQQAQAAAQAAAVQAAYGNDTVCLLFACFLSEHGRLSCPHRLAMSAVVFYARDARGGDGSIEPHVLHTS